ncbi:MAG: excinuclease ABC subunit UvrC, partial [Burkholderiales bacterium]
GKEDEVIERLAARMSAASGRLRYEEAAACRDQIAALRQVREKQFVSGGGEDADVIACGRAAGIVCVNLAMVRGGRHLGDKNFYPRNADDCNPEQVLEAFVLQHYLQHGVPPQIVVGARLDAPPLEQLLAERAGHKVRISINPSGARRAWLEMAVKNAQLGAGQALASLANHEARLTALQQVLELPDTAHRIECFDVSHTLGEAAVASCVVYDGSAMQKGEYRRYNIAAKTDNKLPLGLDAMERTQGAAHRVAVDEWSSVDSSRIVRTQGAAHRAAITPGDDYAALRDALSRRYRKLVAGEGKMPDLVLIDGGKGQLAVAIDVFEELGLSDVALAAVAKGEARRPGQEQLLVAGRPDPLALGADHPALHLIQQIRDEAHRFALQGHRARRGKARSSSPLENIAGIGVKRRQKLLARFGGLRGLQAASVEELASLEGISRALAEKVYHELH